MDQVQLERLKFLTSGPVPRTLRGTRGRIERMNWDDLALLLQHFHCAIQDLDHELCRSRSIRARPSHKIEEGELLP